MNEPSAALVNAGLINGWLPLGGQSPNYDAVSGRVNLKRSLITPEDIKTQLAGLRDNVEDGTSFTVITPDKYTTLRVTLTWTEPPEVVIQNAFRFWAESQTDDTISGNGIPETETDFDNNVLQISIDKLPKGQAVTVHVALSIHHSEHQLWSLVWRFFHASEI